MTNVLYLSYDGMTDPLGQSQVIPYVAGLSKQGYQFHLVSFEKPEAFRRERAHVQAQMNAHGITWHPLPYTKKPPVFSTMRDLARMKRLGSRIVAEHDIQIVHCRSYISGLVGLNLQKSFGIRFLFDMRGFWADERIDGAIWTLSNPVYQAIYRFFKRKEREMLAAADAVVCLTAKAVEIMAGWGYRSASVRVPDVIPCCADLDLFQPGAVDPHTRAHLEHKLALPEGSKVLSYLGAIGTWYMLDEMMSFFEKLHRRDPSWIFIFITHEHPDSIHKAMQRQSVPEGAVRILSARRQEVPAALSLCQASLFFIKPSFSKQASSPTKQGEIMGMGIPLVCNSGIGDTDAVVRKYECGTIVDLADPESWEHALESMDKLVSIPPARIRQGADEFYSLRSGVEKYAAIYKYLVELPPTGGDTVRPSES